MEEPSHDPQNPTLLPAPHNSLPKTILVTVVLLVLLLITAAAGYWLGSTTLFPALQMENTATTTVQSVVTSTTESLETYRNDEYGFEFQYPAELTFEVEKSTKPSSDDVFFFRIYDSKYVAPPDAVGATYRSGLAEVRFDVFKYSESNLEEISKEIQEAIHYQEVEKPWLEKHKEYLINKESNIVGYELWSGLIGTYFLSIFHNDKYLFRVDAYLHYEDLAKEILTTFKFIN